MEGLYQEEFGRNYEGSGASREAEQGESAEVEAARAKVLGDRATELREALQYANHGGKLSRQSILGLDWVKETARKSQVAVIGAGVQGSISTLPPGRMEALCAAASESGDRVAGIVKKHTVMAKRALPRFTPSSVSGPTVDQLLSDPVAASEAASDAAPAVPTDSSLLHMRELGSDGSSVLQLELADPAVLEVLILMAIDLSPYPNPVP